MFGFQGGEAADIVARKAGYMKDAQQKWKFLTNFDCSTIKTRGQLSSMIQTRSSISAEQADRTSTPGCKESNSDGASWAFALVSRAPPTRARQESTL